MVVQVSKLLVCDAIIQIAARLVLEEWSTEGLGSRDARVAGTQPGFDADVPDAQDVQRAIVLLEHSQGPKTGLVP